jgi:hypothetical protein
MPPKINKYGLASGALGINFIFSLVVFAIAIFSAPFITQILQLTEGNWFYYFLLRVLWFSLPMIWFFASTGFYLAAFLKEKQKMTWTIAGIIIAIVISGFFCRNYILDLSSGLLTVRGQIIDSEITRMENGFYYHYIDSRVVFESEAGKQYVFKATGNKAVQWEEFLQTEENKKNKINLTVLSHAGILLNYSVIQ